LWRCFRFWWWLWSFYCFQWKSLQWLIMHQFCIRMSSPFL
jgi:hypothetical protein